mgnify:CR=1 FL=1
MNRRLHRHTPWIAGWLLAFTLSLDDVVLASFVSGPGATTLPVYLFSQLRLGMTPEANALAVVMLGLAGLVLAVRPIATNVGVKMLAGVGLYGAATLAFGLSRWLPFSLAMLALLGAGDMISVNIRQTLVQIVTPDHMRGRVASVSGLFISGSNELGEFESGIASLAGLRSQEAFSGECHAALLTGWDGFTERCESWAQAGLFAQRHIDRRRTGYTRCQQYRETRNYRSHASAFPP